MQQDEAWSIPPGKRNLWFILLSSQVIGIICTKQPVVSQGVRRKRIVPYLHVHNVFMQAPFKEARVREKYHIAEDSCQQAK